MIQYAFLLKVIFVLFVYGLCCMVYHVYVVSRYMYRCMKQFVTEIIEPGKRGTDPLPEDFQRPQEQHEEARQQPQRAQHRFDNVKLNFGRYAGWTHAQVFDRNETVDYMDWVMKQENPTPALRRLQLYFQDCNGMSSRTVATQAPVTYRGGRFTPLGQMDHGVWSAQLG